MNSNRNNNEGNTENFLQIKKELDNTKIQVNELNNEIDKLRHDKELLIIEKNENKINLIKERDNRNFNNKILKLSEYNPANLQKNIEYKIENKFKQNMSLKDKEIEDLTNKLSQSEQKYELLLAEYEEYKIQT